jgi:predicted Zn-ribbon and HTH transcriptional regulator
MLTYYSAAYRAPEWVALRDYRDHLIIEGRERLTNLLRSNDLVLIGHAVRDYRGVPEVEDLWTPLELHFETLSDVYLTQAPHHKRKPAAVSPGSARIPVDEIDHVIEERLVTRLHEQVSERKAAEHRYRDEEVKRKQLEMQVSQLAELARRHQPTLLAPPDAAFSVPDEMDEEEGGEPRSRCPVCGAYVLASQERSHAESCAKQLLATHDSSF